MFDHRTGLRSFCPCGVFLFGARAMTVFRLRWLSERGRGDRGHFVPRWILKRLPDWGGEWGLWLSRLCPSCNRPPPGFVYFFSVEGASCADGSAPIGAESPSHKNPAERPATPATGQKSLPKPDPHRPHHPNLKSTSASPPLQCEQDRDNPAPITIEAGIHSSPVSRSGTPRTDKKIRNQSPMPDTKPRTPPISTSASCRL